MTEWNQKHSFSPQKMKLCLVFGSFLLCVVAGCKEAGRVRVSDQEIIGSYSLDFQNVAFSTTGQKIDVVRAKEQLTLNSDKTYAQVFSSAARQFTNRGAWESSNRFLGGTEIELKEAALFEDMSGSASPLMRGTLFLQVHREKGRLKLARNEAADWYYDRIP